MFYHLTMILTSCILAFVVVILLAVISSYTASLSMFFILAFILYCVYLIIYKKEEFDRDMEEYRNKD
jgi:amino acid permease